MSKEKPTWPIKTAKKVLGIERRKAHSEKAQSEITNLWGKITAREFQYMLANPFNPNQSTSVLNNIFAYNQYLNSELDHILNDPELSTRTLDITKRNRKFVRWTRYKPPRKASDEEMMQYVKTKLKRNAMFAINDALELVNSIVGQADKIDGFNPEKDNVFDLLRNSFLLRGNAARTSDENNMKLFGTSTSLGRALDERDTPYDILLNSKYLMKPDSFKVVITPNGKKEFRFSKLAKDRVQKIGGAIDTSDSLGQGGICTAELVDLQGVYHPPKTSTPPSLSETANTQHFATIINIFEKSFDGHKYLYKTRDLPPLPDQFIDLFMRELPQKKLNFIQRRIIPRMR